MFFTENKQNVIIIIIIISIAAIASGICLPVGISLSATSMLLSLATTITRKTISIFNSKEKKHDDIRLLAQSKLESISGTISQAIQDENVSPTEFHKILQETENYRKLKADIRKRADKTSKTFKRTA